MSVLKFIIKKAVTLPRPEDMKTVLFVGPHPDDIEIGAGATAAKLAAMGKRVCFLICTDGRYGDRYTEVKGDELAALRESESVESARMLGVEDVRFLRFSDGGFYSTDDMKAKLVSVIGDVKPDMIFCPDPDVISECHPDHLNVGRICKEIACLIPYEGIAKQMGSNAVDLKAIAFYMTAKVNSYVSTRGFFSTQLRAVFDCHLSQFPRGGSDAYTTALYLKLRAYIFGLKNLSGTAEGFRILGQTHMHCLPEAGE